MSAKTLRRLHLAGVVIWAGNLPLLLFRSVRESVAYVAFCSVYANFVGHFGAYDAARAESD